MSTLRVLIVDDERLARQKLRRYLAGEPGVTTVTECTGGADAVQAIRRERPDVVFLDVQMPDIDGFDVLRQVGLGRAGAVVFVTAHDEYALRAFDVEAIDYLVKPFDRERFKAALERARRRTEPPVQVNGYPALPATADQADLARRRIVVRVRGRIVLLDANEIEWIESADNCARLHTTRQAYLVRHTLAELEARLDPHRFVRVHRRAIVNIDAVIEVRPRTDGGREMALRGGASVKVGRTHRRRLRHMLET